MAELKIRFSNWTLQRPKFELNERFSKNRFPKTCLQNFNKTMFPKYQQNGFPKTCYQNANKNCSASIFNINLCLSSMRNYYLYFATMFYRTKKHRSKSIQNIPKFCPHQTIGQTFFPPSINFWHWNVWTSKCILTTN